MVAAPHNLRLIINGFKRKNHYKKENNSRNVQIQKETMQSLM